MGLNNIDEKIAFHSGGIIIHRGEYPFFTYVTNVLTFYFYIELHTEACSCLDYHGETRRIFVGLDNGTIAVSFMIILL